MIAHPIRLVVSALLISATSIATLAVAFVTLFRARRVYAAITTRLARLVLSVCGIRMRVHGTASLPTGQAVYVSNHSSTIDLFALVALGLPNTRFFLSGFLQKLIPLAILARLMGTFFTVPQDRPDERRRIFAAAADVLRRTGESVYLSPEGTRVITGEIGHFNKGAFHMAISLRAPIVPLYFYIPPDIDPGRGYRSQPGTIDVYVKPPIDTSTWKVEHVVAYTDAVRRQFVDWHARAWNRASDGSAAGVPNEPAVAVR